MVVCLKEGKNPNPNVASGKYSEQLYIIIIFEAFLLFMLFCLLIN